LIENAERESDVIIVADFGHGLLNDKRLISKINNLKCFVSLMVQTNSLNYGFNLITKYKKADFFVIDQREADLALKSRDKNYIKKIKFLSKKLKTSKSVITMGKKGCLIIDTKTGELIERSPKVMSQIVLDTVGSGDAFFSITSLLSYCNFEISKIADLGNVAGHFAVSYLGNEYNLGKLFKNK
jgi:bifunctional ADP-heptose synthase (sugar kinase/adenylyltransferase)